MRTFWTDEETELLRQMWTTGSSIADIAAELRRHNDKAVGAKIGRLGLSKPLNTWSAEEIETLTTLCRAGRSCSQIAGVLPGRSKNAVIGKIDRLGLNAAGLTQTQVVARKKNQSAMSSRNGKRLYDEGRSALQKTIKRTPRGKAKGAYGANRKVMLIEVSPMIESRKISLSELTESTCKWPTNDDMRKPEFCGHPVSPRDGRRHYCAHHQWVASPRSEIRCDSPSGAARNWTPMGDLKVA